MNLGYFRDHLKVHIRSSLNLFFFAVNYDVFSGQKNRNNWMKVKCKSSKLIQPKQSPQFGRYDFQKFVSVKWKPVPAGDLQ
jgi:hypothetical protein